MFVNLCLFNPLCLLKTVLLQVVQIIRIQNMKHLFIITIIFFSANLFSQTKTVNEKYLQISGVVLDDSLQPLPFVSIMLKGTRSGTVSDFYGFFTIVARPGDELQFFSINHKSKVYNLSDTLTGKHYSIIQILTKDTIQLAQGQCLFRKIYMPKF